MIHQAEHLHKTAALKLFSTSGALSRHKTFQPIFEYFARGNVARAVDSGTGYGGTYCLYFQFCMSAATQHRALFVKLSTLCNWNRLREVALLCVVFNFRVSFSGKLNFMLWLIRLN